MNLLNSVPEILIKTSRWLVVSKPSGWLTIPGRSAGHNPIPVLSEWVRQEHAPMWVVHRLDRETSGVVLFALSEKDHKEANGWFQKRQVKKVYHCLASGTPSVPILKIKLPIEGAPSLSQVEVKETFREGFFARVMPHSGRRHQIRIHLSSQGFPIWGDVTYGGVKQVHLEGGVLPIERVALHSSSLELPTGERFESPFPEDFQNWLNELREKGIRNV